MRTTLKSTESSAYGSLGPWHTLGSQLHHIYGWEASWTTLVYTTHIHSTCTKVGSDRRHRGEKEYASVTASWASSALLPVLPSTMPSVGMERATLHLSRASEQLLGPSSGRNRLGGGCGRPTRRPSSIGPSCSPPTLPTAASLATTSVVVMIGNVCAVSGSQTASLSVALDLWRCSQKRYQRA